MKIASLVLSGLFVLMGCGTPSSGSGSGSGPSRIHAEVADTADVDPGSGEVILLGISVRVNSSTDLRDEQSTSGDLDLADLDAGDFLETRGDGDDSGDLIADRMERKDTSGPVRLRATVEAFDPVAQTVTLAGVLVETDVDTDYEDLLDNPISAAEFFDTVAVGDIVQATGDDAAVDKTVMGIAHEVEFED